MVFHGFYGFYGFSWFFTDFQGFPSIFTSQFINVFKHFFFRESDILFIAIFVTPLSCRFEKVANEDFGTEAEMLPLEVLDAFLLEVLKIEPTEKFFLDRDKR